MADVVCAVGDRVVTRVTTPSALRRGITVASWALLIAAICRGEGELATTLAAQATTAIPLAEIPSAPEPAADLLRIDDDMRHYFSGRISTKTANSRRLRQIVDAILRPEGLNFAYDAQATQDARQTFITRRGNCVSFALLVVAITREFGFKATFQNIDTLPNWNRFGTLIASLQHVNVRVTASDGVYIVDLRPDAVPQNDIDAVEVVSDEREFAQFYNNIGFFLLVHDRPDDALTYTKRSVEVDPTYAAGWANLGSLQARRRNWNGARDCYERSLALNRRGLVALVGIVEVLRQLGTPEDLRRANQLDRRAEAIRSRNPYYQQYLAGEARERGNLAEAEKLLKLAISLKDDDPQFYEEWIAVLQGLGRDADARRASSKLAKLKARLDTLSPHIAD